MKLLLDENLSPQHAVRLRAAGYDAVAANEVGLGGASDSVVRSAAIGADRILVTLDADFGNLLRYPADGTPGVIWLRLHPPTATKIVEALARCLKMTASAGLSGKLAVVDEDKIRVRARAPG